MSLILWSGIFLSNVPPYVADELGQTKQARPTMPCIHLVLVPEGYSTPNDHVLSVECMASLHVSKYQFCFTCDRS